jgi:hypothetical protein
MFPFDPERLTAGEVFATHATAAAAAAAAGEQPVFIQLGASQARADIFRDDYAIPAFEIDPTVIDEIIVGPPVVNKVVSQSIAPGTIVAKGTEITVVLAPPDTVPGRIIRDGHVALADLSMFEVYTTFVRDNPSVSAALSRSPNVAQMSTGDQAILTQAAEAGGIDLGDDPAHSVGAFATSLHLARTMMES